MAPRRRDWIVAAGFAAWCTGWLWALIGLTRPAPGVFSGSGDQGAVELLTVMTKLPWHGALMACFVVTFALPLLWSTLRFWLDPADRGSQPSPGRLARRA